MRFESDFRIFDIADPLVIRPGMYIEDVTVKNIYHTMMTYDWALRLKENFDREDLGQPTESFFDDPGPLSNFVSYVEQIFEVDLTKSHIHELFLAQSNGSEEKACELFQEIYKNFRGKNYRKYMPTISDYN